MKTLYEKLQAARQSIAATEMKKAGFNEYSKYNYFTPEQVKQLVDTACFANGLLTTFSLCRNECGVYGELAVIEIETGDTIRFTAATAIPNITATNEAQKLGGCMTFTERYLKQSVFGIADNTLDFDAHNNTKTEEKPEQKQEDKRPWMTEKQYNDCIGRILNGDETVLEKAKESFRMKREYVSGMEQAIKEIPTYMKEGKQ